MRLCVFPNDPLSAYLKKGEIKPRYFNPKNMFSEIHVISLFEVDCNAEQVQELAGNAKLTIHTVGRTTLLNVRFIRKKIIRLLQEIKPDIIRSYNPLLQGWLAVQAGRRLGIPAVISLMGDYDRDLRYFAKKNRNYIDYLKLVYSRVFLERYSIRNADEIIIIYNFIRRYAEDLGAKNINLIYNRIDLTHFSPEVQPAFDDKRPVVICVGRLMSEKNQECIIKAVKDIDVLLVLVGDGPQYQELVRLVKDLGIENKVRFERAVPNLDMPKYYAASDIFALPIKYGGFAIPVLEAAASGIPVILPKQTFETTPEIISEFALLVDNNPESFREGILRILNNTVLKQKMIQDGLFAVRKINGNTMEQKEMELYLKIIKEY